MNIIWGEGEGKAWVDTSFSTHATSSKILFKQCKEYTI